MTMALVTVFLGFIYETHAYHEYPSPKRLAKESKLNYNIWNDMDLKDIFKILNQFQLGTRIYIYDELGAISAVDGAIIVSD